MVWSPFRSSSGAGLVYLASVEPVIQLVLTRTPECCALPLSLIHISANESAIASEWARYGLATHADVIFGQEVGSKANSIASMLACGYERLCPYGAAGRYSDLSP